MAHSGPGTAASGEYVEFVRRWLCLDAARDKGDPEPHWQVSTCRR